MQTIIYWDFHEASDNVDVGDAYHPTTGNTMVLEIDGDSTDFQVNFEAKGSIGNSWYAYKCANLSTIKLESSTIAKGIWQVDLTAINGFRANLVTLNNGNITAKGRVVTV